MRNALMVLALSALAILTTQFLSSGAWSQQEPPRLGPGDSLEVAVYGMPDVSGTFSIASDGTIRMPLAGSVPTANKALEEIEDNIAQALSEHLDNTPSILVSVAAYRPIYVVGDVAAPGEYPFRAGLTAYAAFAMAGAFPSLHQLPAERALDAAQAETDLLQARNTLVALTIRREALRAALQDTEITLPDDIAGISENPAIKAIIEQQTHLLQASRESLADSQRLLREQHARLSEEIQALTAEANALKDQAATVQQEVQSIESLAQRGLTTNQRRLELSRMKLELESGRHRQTALLSRARVEQVQLELQYQQLAASWRTERREELSDLITEIENVRAARDAAAARRTLLSGMSGYGLLSSMQLDELAATFLVHRVEDGRRLSFEVKDGEPLEPGDVLEIRTKSATQVSEQ